MRIISRLNVGGPAIQVITLADRLTARGYRTTLVRGREESHESNMDYLARQLEVQPELVSSLRRNLGWRDGPALIGLMRILHRERPDIVHTHAAKAGALGRAAMLLACPSPRRRTVAVHTFHGHSLTGYFRGWRSRLFLMVERALGRVTDRLIAVSDEVRNELVRLGVASADRFEVVPVGFDLSKFVFNELEREQRRQAVRAELGVPSDAQLVTLIARLVPIKRVDRFLRVANSLADVDGVHFLIVGDGELRTELQSSPEARALDGKLTWAGFRRDINCVCAASDVVTLTSDSEGTPVSLIESQAAGVPVVSTNVGGTPSVVVNGVTGLLVPRESEPRLADRVRDLLADPELRGQMGERGRLHVLGQFSLERLVSDVDGLYRRLLQERRQG